MISHFTIIRRYSKIGSKIFNEEKIKEAFNNEKSYNIFKTQKMGNINNEYLKKISKNLSAWAIKNGCIDYTHWFSPLRNSKKYAEKYETIFNEIPLNNLLKTETDGSSFPNGNLRKTNAATSYVIWDTKSHPFILDKTLYIPGCFVSYNGDSLDYKIPLLRSNIAINKECIKLLRLTGNTTSQSVNVNIGWEQEFFIIDRKQYLKRLDLRTCGRTLFGLPHIKGQQLDDYYFSPFKPRIKKYLNDLRKQLLEIGIPISTIHNEVAPAQCEITPIYSLSENATDQNSIAMQIMENIAQKHDLSVLLHEKPFSGLNGSGKHLNWSLNTDDGINLCTVGKTQNDKNRFMLLICAILSSFTKHGDLIRIGTCDSLGNDYRLGSNEAPPSIMSVNIGDELEEYIMNLLNDEIKTSNNIKPIINCNISSIPIIEKDQDRNRTSPFPWCGNRFEFRAVGSSQNIAFPITLLNASIASSLNSICNMLENGMSCKDIILIFLKENKQSMYNGDCYSNIWKKEAKKRNLFNLPQSIDAFKELTSKKNTKLLTDMNIFNLSELNARNYILYDNYIKNLLVEATCILKMSLEIKSFIYEYLNKNKNIQIKILYKQLCDEIFKLKVSLTTIQKYQKNKDIIIIADYCKYNILTKMTTIRNICNELEFIIPDDIWIYPKYEKLLYSHLE